VVGSVDGSHAYLGSYFTGSLGWYKADFTNNTCTFYSGTGSVTTAMTLDLANNVWTANYNASTVSKFTSNGTLLGTYAAGGSNPHGLSVDFLGNIWTIT